ncbi:peptidoglycan DD-metalloendopeptidase family protein [Metabacillus idriensis]|uniref:M23 family metallopeptidase n=1 Tax=Metabacillus idriensis TaxID=324768 RepID=UPI003D2A0A93
MLDLLRRLSIALIVGVCIVLLFVSGTQAKAEELNWSSPLKGTITDTFGTRGGKHKGIDIAAPDGTVIQSVQEGIVTKSYYSDTYGHVVFIQHPEGYETVYAHLSKRSVPEGSKVKKGHEIGVIGNTGASRGTHLHFEIHKGKWSFDKKNAVNPFLMVAASKIETVPVLTMPAAAAVQNPASITVKKGDTLWGLGKTYGLTVEAIKELNGLSSNTLAIGQKLIVNEKPDIKTYTVKKGDTLFSIADEFQVTVLQLKKENRLKTEAIFPYQNLKISNLSSSSE